jgi:predicted dehydrogenase
MLSKLGGAMPALRKVWRYLRIYGLGRTWFKVAGRSRHALLLRFGLRRRGRGDIAMIGCGQFAFATIGYYLRRRSSHPFAECFDIAAEAAAGFARFYDIAAPAVSASSAIESSQVRVVYIASNHATHTEYAIAALAAGKTTYVEKPVAVSIEQLRSLAAAVRRSPAKIFAGYNRPFSAAVVRLHEYCREQTGPLTLSCFVSGHKLDADHWYRRPAEGTRICGNVGHWLDLAVHMLCWRELPDRWRISLSWSNDEGRDDDLSIALASERGDLVNIVLTARSEPFEGINETINLQWGAVIAKIDDFRRMEVWRGSHRRSYRFWPKDVGHRAAILQPFTSARRPWREVELSSLLMLRIADMVVRAEPQSEFSFSAAAAAIDAVSAASSAECAIAEVMVDASGPAISG